MKVIKESAYIGPNVIAAWPLVHLRVEMTGPEAWPDDSLDPGPTAALLQLLPGLADHPGREGKSGGLIAELRCPPGLLLGRVVAGVAAELLRGGPGGLKSAGVKRQAGNRLQDIYFGYDDPEIGLLAGRAALAIGQALLPSRENSSAEDSAAPKARAVLASFSNRAKVLTLDQTALALIAEAEKRDIPWFVLDRGMRMVQLGQGRYLNRIRGTITNSIPNNSVLIQRFKDTTNRLFATTHLPVPKQVAVGDAETAVRAANRIGYPVVVKPQQGGKERGTSVNLRDDEAVRKAFAFARRHQPRVLIENYVAGKDHRILVVNGRVVAAVLRLAAAVTGDGQRTIAELVAEANKDPRRGIDFDSLMNRINLDEEVKRTLSERGYHYDSIPPAGEVVDLRGTAHISAGSTAIDVTDKIHPENRIMLERAARVAGLDIAGVDFITPDISRSYREVGGAICEINSSPRLRPHQIAEGPPRDVVSPIIGMMFPDNHNGRIPVAAITGTNGKTTTSRMLAHILRIAGSDIGVKSVGLATTDGVHVNDDLVAKGDFAGRNGARALLRDPSVDAAIVESARGGILIGGIAFDWCDVGAVTNVTADHLGLDGIETLEEMAAVKSTVCDAARKLCVLNADDALCLGMAAERPPERVCLFTLQGLSDAMRDHLAKGGLAITLEDDPGNPTIILHRHNTREVVVPVKRIPATLDGAARHNTQNAMAAIGMAFGLGLPLKRIAEALTRFSSAFDSNPGRLNVYDGLPFTVVMDFAHNPDGVRVTCETVARMEAKGRRICVLGCIGHRHAEHIDATTAIVADQFDCFICTRNKRISEEREALRGFPSEEITTRIAASLVGQGVESDNILVIDNDKEAVNKALQLAESGDLLLVLIDDKEWCWKRITEHRA